MKKIILSVISLFALNFAIACTFFPISFCNVNYNDNIITGQIINVDANGIDLAVIDVLRGFENRDTIRIWNGVDYDCNGTFVSMTATVNLGQVGEIIVVILPTIYEIQNAWDIIGDYRTPNVLFTETVLKIQNGMASGFYTVDIPYFQLQQNILDGNCASNCQFFSQVYGSIINSTTKRAEYYLVSSAQITNGTTNFISGNFINLQNDFEVFPQANFIAEIDSCDSGYY